MATKYSGPTVKAPQVKPLPLFLWFLLILINVWILLQFILVFVNEISPELYQILITKAVSR